MEQQQIVHNRRVLGCQRKIRSFRANFDKMIAVAQYNMIQIMTADNFRVIDVLEGHQGEIKCVDVSQISKAVISFSNNLLLVHAPIKSEGHVMADHVISAGTIKWKEYWRQELKLQVRNLTLSPIGDFFVMSGSGFLTIWIRDTPTDFTFSQFVYFQQALPKGVIATVIKEKPNLGSIIQQSVSRDGRLIVCLEQGSQSLKIFYQDRLIKVAAKEEKREIMSDYQRYGGYQRYNAGGYRYGGKDERVDVVLDNDNPYANIVGDDLEGGGKQGGGGGDLRFQSDEPMEYCLPKHKYPILYFKMLHHDIYESEKRYLPNVILTITAHNEVFLWQENLLCAELQFTCVHVFRGYSSFTFFDAVFLDFPPINPKRYVELKTNISRFFDTSTDRTLQLKKEEENNVYGIYKQNYVETSLDWVLVLNDAIIDIYKAEGLRNFPHRGVNVYVWNRVKMTHNPRDFFGSCKIISASCRDFNDILSLYTLNTQGQLIKLRKDFKEENVGKWRVDKVAILKRKYIQDIVVHEHLPILAHLINKTELYFFIEEKTKNRIVKESLTGGSMKFLGAYSVYHSLIRHHRANETPSQIVRVKWVNSPLCQMIVQFENDTLALISSQSQLRILSHSKFKDEYMKLWDGSDKSRAQIVEKWEKLYEIHFNQGGSSSDHNEPEHIVDFEVIKSSILPGNNGFQVNLAIFTSFNQYLVYETQTTLQANLKTLSQTKLLYHVYTTDNLIQMLASVRHQSHSSSNEAETAESLTVMALLTEVDPKRQRKELKEKAEKEAAALAAQKASSNPYGDFDQQEEEEEDDDDGDIFAQFSAPKKKKPELLLKKKPQQVQEIVPEVKIIEQPLKPTLIVKIVQFDEQSTVNKQSKELWSVEMPLDFKKKLVKCKANENYFAFMTKETVQNEDQLFVFIYDLMQGKYLGFINLSQQLGIPDLAKIPVDMIFSSGTPKGSLTIYVKDSLYLIAESSRDGKPGKWSLIRKIENVLGFDKSQEIKEISIHESHLRKQMLLVNKQILSVREKFTLRDKATEVIKQPLYQIYAQSQKSCSLYDPKVLKLLFVKGYVQLVLKIIVQLAKTLDLNSSSQQVPEFLDLDLAQIMQEVQDLISANSTAQNQGGSKKKQETASSIFDDFYGGFGFDTPQQKNQDKKADSKKADQLLEQQFEEFYPQLMTTIRVSGEQLLALKDSQQKAQLIDFLKRFKQIYKKEFFADNLTSILLRDLFFDTEDIGEEEQEEQKEGQSQGNPFNAAEYMQKLRAKPSTFMKASIASIKQWNSLQTCFALHSEMQDVLLNELSERFDFEANLNYDLLKKLCIPLWLKDIPKLKNLVNIIAKNEYKSQTDDFGKQSRAEKTALWYIMLERKDQLIRLYKQEPAYKKVYELLLNDFTQARWKTAAEKNAMALMSKKNLMLACAFFLLGGNIKDAVKLALDKMCDPVLALLMVKLTEKESFSESAASKQQQESLLDKIYQDEFIGRGERLGDPYLQNIGYWQRKDFLKAINLFEIDRSKQNNIASLFKWNQTDFNIFYGDPQQNQASLDARALLQAQKEQAVVELVAVPLPSSYDYYALDIIKTLKKSTMVKRSLQQTSWNSGSKYAAAAQDEGSIFDDFFGGGQAQKAKEKAQIVTEKKTADTKLTIDESKVLEYVAVRTSQNGFTLQAMVTLAENPDFSDKVSPFCKHLISYSLISDIMNSPTFQYPSIKKLKASAQYLTNQFKLDISEVRSYILTQFVNLDAFIMQVNYMAEDEEHSSVVHGIESLQCVEEQALKMVDFVHSLADFPFALNDQSLPFVRYTVKKAISYLESLAESYIIVDMQQQIAKEQKEKAPSPPKNLVSMTIADPDEGNYEFTVEEEKGNLNLKNLDLKNRLLKQNTVHVQLTDELETALQQLGSKTRITLVLYMGLVQVCMVTKKFQLVRDLLADFRALLNQAGQIKDQQVALFMQKLKTSIQKLKYSVNNEDKKEEDEGQRDQFELKFAEKPKTKEEIAEESQKRKLNQFIELWFQYLINHNMLQVMRFAYEKTQIQEFINLRPSIVDDRPMHSVVELILNPRISATELLKKFVNYDRVLENVTTYYFENFLNLQERTIISSELQAISANRFEISKNSMLDLGEYFGSEKRFAEFAQYIEMGTYVKHVRDHELSLVGHKNHDYSVKAVERTQTLFENGIDIFRMRGETVNGFAFDRCDMDLVAIALQSRGIREVPIKNSLLYRNRHNKGHQVVDEELGSWHDCLHRFNRVAQEHSDIRPQSEAIIAAIDKLYQYKTINYVKKLRRERGTFFLDYEMSPPDYWSGSNSSEYLKNRSEYDITHEDYANAVESHPYLPLYLTGNSRGMLCLWEFNQFEDRSLEQWVTEQQQSITDTKGIDPKRSTIKKVLFNSYGDQIFASNMDGNLFIFKFDIKEQHRGVPIYTLKKGKEEKVSDFEILSDNVFAMASAQKTKHLWIYDTMTNARGGLVMESTNCGGTVVQPYKSKSQLLLFNGDKAGQMTVFDLKMNKAVTTLNLHSEEVTSVAINEAENTLVAGFKDGIIKIFNMTKDFETRESYSAFSQVGNKKGGVAQVRIHPTNGALYAASTIGNFKLFRTRL